MLVLWKASQSSDLEFFLTFPKSMLILKKKKRSGSGSGPVRAETSETRGSTAQEFIITLGVRRRIVKRKEKKKQNQECRRDQKMKEK